MNGSRPPTGGAEPGDLDGRMVTFGMAAKTPEARDLVEGVEKAVEAWEKAKGGRTRKRTQKASASLRIALEGIVAAAIL